jgi:hypothetical protein
MVEYREAEYRNHQLMESFCKTGSLDTGYALLDHRSNSFTRHLGKNEEAQIQNQGQLRTLSSA